MSVIYEQWTVCVLVWSEIHKIDVRYNLNAKVHIQTLNMCFSIDII